VGVFLATWLVVRLGLASLPRSMSWWHVLGLGMLGGIGFTVALFVNELAFDNEVLVSDGKMGILAASLISAIIGYVMLRIVTRNPVAPPEEDEREVGAGPG
jgi:NhaA family Na+:H+ antiporter